MTETPIQWSGPKKLGNLYAIDSGAVFRELDAERGSLTMVNMACSTAMLGLSFDKAAWPSCVMTQMEEGTGPFGAIAPQA